MSISSVTYIASDLIRLNLSFSARIDTDYKNIAGYYITGHAGSPIVGVSVNVLAVLIPKNDVVVSPFVYLHTTPHTLGAEYEVNYGKLYDSSGVLVPAGPNVPYQSRSTKTVQMLKSVPSHFDRQVESLIRNLVTAVSLEDDTIGGSRKDVFP
jgi:hypothetical protein